MSKSILMSRPTPQAVFSARMVAGHTQEQAAAVIGSSSRRWSDWETGLAVMPLCKWTVYALATRQHATCLLMPRYRAKRRSAASRRGVHSVEGSEPTDGLVV